MNLSQKLDALNEEIEQAAQILYAQFPVATVAVKIGVIPSNSSFLPGIEAYLALRHVKIDGTVAGVLRLEATWKGEAPGPDDEHVATSRDLLQCPRHVRTMAVAALPALWDALETETARIDDDVTQALISIKNRNATFRAWSGHDGGAS